MPIEPVSLTLGVIALIAPIYTTFRSLQKGWRLTQAFGQDYDDVLLDLEIAWESLEEIACRYTDELERVFDWGDENHKNTSLVLKLLISIRTLFEQADRLISHYTEKEKDELAQRQKARSIGTSSSSATLATTARPNDADSSSTSVSSTQLTTGSKEQKHSSDKKKFFRLIKRPVQVRLQDSQLSAQRPIITAVLTSDTVTQAGQQEQLNAEHYQQDVTFWRRCAWADHDRETFKEVVSKVERRTKMLQAQLARKHPQDPEVLVKPPDDTRAWIQESRNVKYTLQRLHEAIRNINGRSSKTNRTTANKWKISVKLSQSIDDANRDTKNALHTLSLRKNSDYFFIQREDLQTAGPAEGFVAEVGPVPSATIAKLKSQSEDSTCWSLERCAIPKLSDTNDTFQKWGNVWADDTPNDVIWLFHDQTGSYHSQGSLMDQLNQTTSARLSRYWRASLAVLVTLSYLHLELVQQSCEEISLASFRYFHDSQDLGPWDENDPAICRPYLTFGFGQNPKPLRLGARSGLTTSRDQPILGLGLLLYQIGCCSLLPDANNGVEARNRYAMDNSHLLDMTVSPRFTEIVETCLRYRRETAVTSGLSESSFVEGVASTLRDLRDQLAGIVV